MLSIGHQLTERVDFRNKRVDLNLEIRRRKSERWPGWWFVRTGRREQSSRQQHGSVPANGGKSK